MSRVQEEDQSYRRGLLLGLTMAEIVVLVIFILLLVLGAVFERLSREAEDMRLHILDLERANDSRARIIRDLGNDPEAFKRALAAADELHDQLAIVAREADHLKEQVQQMEAARPKGMEERPLPEIFRELVFLRDAIEEAGIEPTPTALEHALTQAQVAKEVLKAIPDGDALLLVAENKRLTEKAEVLAREKQNLQNQIANLRLQVSAGGRGLDHPPCWATPGGKAEYIFNVALTSNGLIVQKRDLPHRSVELAELPIPEIKFGREVTPSAFLSSTRPLYNWSVEHKCRFVVRAFDTTSSAEKPLYKRHMRVLEQHFYKYEDLSGVFPK